MVCHCRIALCSVRWLKRKSNDSRTRRESCKEMFERAEKEGLVTLRKGEAECVSQS